MSVMTGLTPGATIKHITLDDGQQASVVIQGGRITKILAANGQVAELSWKDDAAMDNSWGVRYHKVSPSSEESVGQYKDGPDGAGLPGSDERLQTPPVQEAPYQYPSHSQPNLFQPEPYMYPQPGASSVRVNSPEMPTILETNSQQPSPEGPASLNPAISHEQHPNAQWNPTNSWLPPAGPPQTRPPASLTGHYPVDRLANSKQAQLYSAPSPSPGNSRSQSLPYGTPPSDGRGFGMTRSSMGDGQRSRRSYAGDGGVDPRYQDSFGPNTPSPQEQRPVSRLASHNTYGDSPQVSSSTAASASPVTPATPGKKKLTMWKRLKNAFTPGKAKREEQKGAAQQLMQSGHADTDPRRFSEKHSQQAQQADSIVHYSRTTSFRESQENQIPSNYRHSVDVGRSGSGLLRHNSRYRDSSLYAPAYSYRTSQPRHYRSSVDSARYELPPDSRPLQVANRHPPPPMHGYPHVPEMLNYPPLKQAGRRHSSNFDHGGGFGQGNRRAVSAHVQQPMPESNDVQRPDYTQSYALPETQPKVSRRTSLSTDYSFAMTDQEAMPPPPLSANNQERLRQQRYLRQQFIQQQQEERNRLAQAPADAQDPWTRPEQKSFDAGSMLHGSTASMSPDKAHQLHSAPTRAFSLDSTQSPEGAEQRRARRIRTMDYSKAGLPSATQDMTGMAGRWTKNVNQGSDGSMVDDLLQLSNLQRLARQKIVEMEIIETPEIFEIVWNIPLNNGHTKIKKSDRYLKSSEVCELPRRDGRQGVLRSQINFTPEGHVHVRALQADPFGAVFHDRIKMSTGGHRLKIEQKFQLLAPGVMPVKHHSIWQRVEEPMLAQE